MSLAGYASLYTWKWSTHDSETAVKDQVIIECGGWLCVTMRASFILQLVEHLASKLRDQSRPTCLNYRDEVARGLKMLLRWLNGELEREMAATNKSINGCSTECKRLEELRAKGKRLK